MESNFSKRKHTRLRDYDYSTTGAYFVTICTHNRRNLLSRIAGSPAKVEYTEYGQIAAEQLLLLEERFPYAKIDSYVIMPNHIHIIFLLDNEAEGAKEREPGSPRPSLTDIVCAYKSLTTRECKRYSPIDKLFQTSFYEHIIRGSVDYEEIARYIDENPTRWQLDSLYSAEH